MKENELGKTPTIDECAEVIKKKYLRENKKEDKLRQFKRMTIEPRETFYDFDSRYLNLYDLLENEDELQFQSLTMRMLLDQGNKYMRK